MWWQRIVADVALEIDSDTGLPAYRDVVLSVMRQQGKTHLVLGVCCERCLLWGRSERCIYTMQDGHNARIKIKEEYIPILKGSPLWRLVERPYLSDGNTNILWKNGSRISVVSNSESSGEGRSEIALVVFDEAHADEDERRERALSPTTATRRDAQLWTPSTPGSPRSVFFRRKVDEGRAAVEAGLNSGIAYFEFAVAEDEDPYDREVLRRRMPAYGVLVHDEYLDAEQRKPEQLYRRNVAGQWTEVEERLIPVEYYLRVARPDVKVGDAVYAVDTLSDRSMSAVARGDRSGNVELVAQRPGTGWIVEAFKEKLARYTPVAIDRTGPLAAVGDDLEKAGFRLIRPDALEVRKACTRFYDDIMDLKVTLRREDRVATAVANATRREVSDAWVWNRDVPGADILMALSLAYAAGLTDAPLRPIC